MTRIRFAALLPILLLLSACSSTPSSHSPALELLVPEEREGAWYAMRFKEQWPEGELPRWYMDTLIAHRVVAPTLRNFQAQIPLWRFHRRAGRDGAGHRFSFIFYTTEAVAAAVFDEIERSELVVALQSGGVLAEVTRGDYGEDAWQLAATSDPDWSDAVQRSWPHFIMGVSRTWLELIVATAEERRGSAADSEALLERYAEIDAEVTTLWSEHGQHAFLHHLNAIYGYKPLEIRY